VSRLGILLRARELAPQWFTFIGLFAQDGVQWDVRLAFVLPEYVPAQGIAANLDRGNAVTTPVAGKCNRGSASYEASNDRRGLIVIVFFDLVSPVLRSEKLGAYLVTMSSHIKMEDIFSPAAARPTVARPPDLPRASNGRRYGVAVGRGNQSQQTEFFHQDIVALQKQPAAPKAASR
jgi:hypothetical protein